MEIMAFLMNSRWKSGVVATLSPPVEPVSVRPSEFLALLLLNAIPNLQQTSSLLRCPLQRSAPGSRAAEPFCSFVERAPKAQRGCRLIPKVNVGSRSHAPPKSSCIKRAGAHLHRTSSDAFWIAGCCCHGVGNSRGLERGCSLSLPPSNVPSYLDGNASKGISSALLALFLPFLMPRTSISQQKTLSRGSCGALPSSPSRWHSWWLQGQL